MSKDTIAAPVMGEPRMGVFWLLLGEWRWSLEQFLSILSLLLALRFDFIETWDQGWMRNASCMLYGLYDYCISLVLLVRG